MKPRLAGVAIATGASWPLTYSCRLLLPAGTGADHTPLDPTCAHPVIWEAPEITGWAPGAACHTTGWPEVPESAAPKLQVLDNR